MTSTHDPFGRLARRNLFGPGGIMWRHWLAKRRALRRWFGRPSFRTRTPRWRILDDDRLQLESSR